MTTKLAIILTIAIAALTIILGCGGIFLFLDPNRSRDLERASMIGSGMGMATTIPVGIVWILWALRVRSERAARKK
ncbi:hypothetical protein LOC68_21935 [Blastopirellula sp. JC732]|uniref:Uncharacterized protein n=1 Tax=Blastopirellula sediminis TaxID=2894196 RepID=A0A9X1SIQ2_9BACT|nr:hypothetical protein [Blastopirellula sediminis]MCC9605639.1 hypothetical protein [Blastopirellula sediminis]MCC9631061.1 hypothetical protein [Blastopirellula sediminis]